jgi:hypothetical protein
MYSKNIRSLDTRHSQHINITSFKVKLQRSLLFEKQTNKKIKHNACKHSIVPLERAMAKQVHSRDCNGQTHSKFTIVNTSDRDINLRRPRLLQKRSKRKKEKTRHYSGTRARQYLYLPEGPTRGNISCSATSITNYAQCIHHFCSRDQLAEARNAITCALTSFVLTSIVIRHAARDTTRGWRNLLKRPLADDVPCSRDHSQKVLATVRDVVLHTHVFCFPIVLSSPATTRRRRLLEKLADRSSPTVCV